MKNMPLQMQFICAVLALGCLAIWGILIWDDILDVVGEWVIKIRNFVKRFR